MAHEDIDIIEDPDDEGEACWSCRGDGYYHDCGEDTCCCAHPDEDDLVTCSDCNGTGWL